MLTRFASDIIFTKHAVWQVASFSFKGIGALYDTFSVHSRGETYKVKSVDEAISFVSQCKDIVNATTADIRISTGTQGFQI